MSWVFVDDHADESEQLAEAGGLAAWYQVCAHGYCRRKEYERRPANERLDFVPRSQAYGLCRWYTPAQARAAVKNLLAVGLWRTVDGGYELTDYANRYGKTREPGDDTPSRPAPEGPLSPRQLGGFARAAQASRGQGGKFQQSPPAGPAGPAQLVPAKAVQLAPAEGRQLDQQSQLRASDPSPDPEPDPDLPGTTTHGPDTSWRAKPDVVVVAGDQRVPCPGNLQLTPAQRASMVSSLIPDWAITPLEQRFTANHAADPSDLRTLVVWRKCLGQFVVGTWNDPNKRPSNPDGPERESETRMRLRSGPRQPNTLDHLDDESHAKAIGARLE